MEAIKVGSNFEATERRIEQYPGKGKKCFTYYKVRDLEGDRSKKIIKDEHFKEAVKNLGGDVYNVCVCNINPKTTLFNGFTWVGIHADTYDECDNWLKTLENSLLKAGWRQGSSS